MTADESHVSTLEKKKKEKSSLFFMTEALVHFGFVPANF